MNVYLVKAAFGGLADRKFAMLVYHTGSADAVASEISRDGWTIKSISVPTREDLSEVDEYEVALMYAKGAVEKVKAAELGRVKVAESKARAEETERQRRGQEAILAQQSREATARAEHRPIDCENCGRKIGILETAHLWHDHVVCRECVQRLEGSSGARPPNKTGQSLITPSREEALQALLWEGGSKPGNTTGFVVFSVALLLLAGLSEAGGNAGASWFFVGIWLISLIVRLAISASSR